MGLVDKMIDAGNARVTAREKDIIGGARGQTNDWVSMNAQRRQTCTSQRSAAISGALRLDLLA